MGEGCGFEGNEGCDIYENISCLSSGMLKGWFGSIKRG